MSSEEVERHHRTAGDCRLGHLGAAKVTSRSDPAIVFWRFGVDRSTAMSPAMPFCTFGGAHRLCWHSARRGRRPEGSLVAFVQASGESDPVGSPVNGTMHGKDGEVDCEGLTTAVADSGGKGDDELS